MPDINNNSGYLPVKGIVTLLAKVKNVMKPLNGVFLLYLLLALMTMEGGALQADDGLTADESKLRAAITIGILRFARWPEEISFKNSLSLCTTGNPPSESILRGIEPRYPYLDIPIVLHSAIHSASDVADCHAVIIGPYARRDIIASLYRVEEHYGLLTICDQCKSREDEVIIRLNKNDNKIGFEVNIKTAKIRGFVFSASFLEIASRVNE